MHKQTVFIPVATLVFVLAAVGPADCKERTSSGSGTVEWERARADKPSTSSLEMRRSLGAGTIDPVSGK